MRYIWTMTFLTVLLLPGLASAHGVDENLDTVDGQWFTGSLESPSPSIPKAGILAVEPYVIYTGNTGAYDNSGQNHSVAHDASQIAEVTLLKYAITDKLSVQAVPLLAHTWNDQTSSSAVGAGDLPIEFDYRLNNQDNATGLPSVTVNLGMNFPTGDYDRLRTTLDGLGSGAYTAKEGILLQSLFDTWDDHPARIRLWGSLFEPLASVSVHDTSVYGTGQGFSGKATPGISTQVGIGAEYGLTQRWVLALDVVGNYAAGSNLSGTDGAGNSVNVSNAPASMSLGIAPAIEYNWSSRMGVIAGVEFAPAGQNSASYIAPQIALSMVF